MRQTVYLLWLMQLIIAFQWIHAGERWFDSRVSGKFTGVHYWKHAKSPYQVVGNLWIDKNAELIVEPGVEIRVMQGCKITVDGVLLAIGEAAAPVLWSVRRDGEARRSGYWQGINFRGDKESRLAFCHIEYAKAGVSLYNGMRLQIRDSRFFRCTVPVRLVGSGLPILKRNQYIGNRMSGFLLTGRSRGGISLPDSKETGLPYIIDGKDFVIRCADTLLVSAGACLMGRNSGSQLIIEEGAYAEFRGSSRRPIIFTSIKDQGPDKGPKPGDWGGVVVAGDGYFRHCAFLYARQALLAKSGSRPSIKRCRFRYNIHPVVLHGNSSPKFGGNRFESNTNQGIRIGGYTSGNAVYTAVSSMKIPYLLSPAGWTVQKGDTINIKSGVTIQAMSSSSGIYVNAGGVLLADGEPDRPVVFRGLRFKANEVAKTAARWKGFHISGGYARFHHSRILDAESAIFSHLNARPDVRHTLFENNQIPIRIAGSSMPRLAKNRFINNKQNGLLLEGSTSGTLIIPGLQESGIAFWLGPKGFVIRPGDTLLIEPGAVLKGVSKSSELQVVDSAVALFRGTKKRPIIFTSIDDNGVGGISGTSRTKFKTWNRIYVSGGKAVFEHVEFRYARTAVHSGQGAHPQIRLCSFLYCEELVRVRGGSLPFLEKNRYIGNGCNGIIMEGRSGGSMRLQPTANTGVPYIIGKKGFGVVGGDTLRAGAGVKIKAWPSIGTAIWTDSLSSIEFTGKGNDKIDISVLSPDSLAISGVEEHIPVWRGIYLNGGRLELINCAVYNAKTGLTMANGAEATVSQSHFESNGFALAIKGTAIPKLNDNTFKNNKVQGIRLTGHTSGNLSLPSSGDIGYPYVITDYFHVSKEDTLLLKGGTVIRRMADSSEFYVSHKAYLAIKETQKAPVVFQTPGNTLERFLFFWQPAYKEHALWEPVQLSVR